ncbi:arylsulfatase [Vibrio lentus]|uniref:MBL fold metallo-hydrolase n=1 Tax=Vibrio lentus TaxID=136468 RepID=UPI000C84CF8A|nr:MBL fold metallo-hydrolase [Vibrio lentus]MCC4817009.1 MBL fold metallo-hydrolase [Vibrio lentus]PMG73443.1 arylsulfatase [Vibrio lentus]PMK90892.1 arylsulfatase [Vibrio lentus]PML21905.1 arylsulfatase [Vibrio lentus]PMM29204.1 arylsulfatase [Vibrio lentus]
MKQPLKALAIALGLTLGANCHAIELKPVDTDFTLQILGSGGPISDDLRASSGEIVWWKGKSRIMIDAGGGVYLRFGQAGAKLEDLDFMGITHFHTDHVNDLPALLKGGYFFERDKALEISGPTAGSAFPSLNSYFAANFDPDHGAYAYLAGLYDGTDGLFPVNLTDVDYQSTVPTVVYEKDGLKITALGIPHGDVPCLAYRIESEEGVMVISADQNGSNPAFLDFARGADIMMMPMAIHEQADGVSTFMHAKPSVIGEIAKEINPKMLVLNHWMGLGLKRKSESIKIVREYYDGPIMSGRDLASFPMSAVKEK